MADRRSLGDALALSPEKLAFIQGSEVKGGTVPPNPVRKETTKTVELPSSGDTNAAETQTERARPRERRQRQRASVTVPPGSDGLLDKMLVPLTTRLPHGLVQSLRRMCLEQRLEHAKPDSIQEIVQTALEDWLLKQTR